MMASANLTNKIPAQLFLRFSLSVHGLRKPPRHRSAERQTEMNPFLYVAERFANLPFTGGDCSRMNASAFG